MSTINAVPFRSTIFYTAAGVPAATGSVLTIGSNGVGGFTTNLGSTMVSIGASTNQTYNNFTNGSYVTWQTAKSAMTSANKTVQSANGLYQLVVANTTSNLSLSSDSGITWSTLTGGLPTLTGSAYWSDGAISANGQYITLSIYGGSLWMSQDYGRTFALTNQPTPNIWLPLNGSTADSMGLSVVTATGSPSYVTLNYPGYTAQAINLVNSSGNPPTMYVRGTWVAPSLGSFTVSLWFNAQSIGGYPYLFGSYTNQFVIAINTLGQIYLYTNTVSGVTSPVATSFSISTNTWYYISASFSSNGTGYMYVNNNLIGTYSCAASAGTSSGIFAIGHADNVIGNAFNGYIDDVRITNSVSTYVPIPLLQPNIWMPFENSTADLGSNAITPTVTGSLSYVPGVVGLNAVNLVNPAGGTPSNYINGQITPGNNVTISAWINFQSISTGFSSVIILGDTTLNLIMIYTNGSTLLFGYNNSSAANITIGSFAGISTNTWYHVYYVTTVGGSAIAYVNGQSVGSGTIASLQGTVSRFALSTNIGSAVSAFNGYIDDFRIYSAAIPIHVLFPQNYRSLALSGTGQYALAAAASGWVVGSSDSSRTWSKQTVTVGTQSDYIQPNVSELGRSFAALTTSPWTINGVTWIASSSSIFNTNTSVNYAFNNISSIGEWVPLSNTYTTAGNSSGQTTTIEGSIGTVTGEWLQIQSSVPLIMASYQFATGNVVARTPKTYYIVGSNNGTTWFPVQYGAAGAVTTTASFTTVPGIITVNSASTQIFGSSTITTTTYATTNNTYSYFRLICLSSYSGTNDVVSLGEWFINFVRPLTDSRPPTHALSMNHTGQYQMVATGPAAGSIMPNLTGLVAYNWSHGGVNWTASSSSVYLNLFAYGAFNTVNSPVGSYSWASNMGTYSTTSPFACVTGISTTIQGIGPTVGEWLQLQSSVPLVMQSYTYGCAGSPNIPKNYYIIGSNDGSTWFPIQLAIMTTNPFTANFQLASTYIIVNQSGTQTISGAQTGSGSFTTYATTTNAYTYFRIVITNLYGNSTLTELGEWYINFSNSVSYSTNYGSTWLNTSRTVSNESVALSPSGQYALSTNSVVPFARLTLDNTNVDAQGSLVPATGAGTVTYSTSIKAVGTHSAQFANTAGGNVINYLNYTVPAVFNKPSALTMSYWVYPTSLSSSGSAPIGFNNGGTTAGPGILCWSDRTECFIYNTSGSPIYATYSSPVSINAWTHLTMTFNIGILTLYVNGISRATTTTSNITLNLSTNNNITNLFLGGLWASSGYAFAGYVDDVRLYTSALNADEINGLFKNPALTQTIAVSSSYLPITGYTEPTLPGIIANIVDSAVSQTGQYMVAVTSSTTNNVYYSTDFGATFTALTVGTSAMVSCSISYDGSYLTVENATTVYTLNRNTRGFSVTVGNQAGLINQAQNAIAIGNQAGRTNQSANSIALNASGSALDAVVPGFYVAPVATAASSSAAPFNLLGYGTDNQIVQSSALTVLQNGNMGIGTTNPYGALHVYGNSTGKIIGFISNANTALGSSACLQYGLWPLSGSSQTGTNSPSAEISAISLNAFNGNTDLAFSVYTGVATTPNYTLVERMRITAAGNVGIGTTNPAGLLSVALDGLGSSTGGGNWNSSYALFGPGAGFTNGACVGITYQSSVNKGGLICITPGAFWRAMDYSALQHTFYVNGAATPGMTIIQGGTIYFNSYTTNGTVTTTGSNGQILVSSDRRIKENIVYQSDTQQGLTSILNLKPATFNMIGSSGTYLGFIAQDLEQEIPLAVDGKKYEWQWETTDDGKPKFDANGDIVYKLDADGNKIVRPRGVSDRAIIATQTLAIQELAKKAISQSTLIQELGNKLTTAEQQLVAKSAALDALIAWAQTQGYLVEA